MARLSKATWRGEVPNRTPKGMDREILGVVLHIMEGTLDGSDSWFKNPKAQASSHFGVGKDGRTYQWVDTEDKAWAQAGGNPSYISIENEGHLGDTLTDPQLNAVAEIVGWVSQTHGVPLHTADHPGDAGLGWHGMGGAAWGGHSSCPGDSIVKQRDQILRKAGGKGTVHPMFDPAIGPIAAAAKWPDGGVLLVSPGGAVYALFGAPYCGGANGQPYFSGRQAAGFEANAEGVAVKSPRGGYTIVATSGETYSYPV
ncbi:MAG: hypothetical protein QOJ93_878 [Actinomycetota bacterium]|nr:hypothetical protein [Actinomycetota bacterium]